MYCCKLTETLGGSWTNSFDLGFPYWLSHECTAKVLVSLLFLVEPPRWPWKFITEDTNCLPSWDLLTGIVHFVFSLKYNLLLMY